MLIEAACGVYAFLNGQLVIRRAAKEIGACCVSRFVVIYRTPEDPEAFDRAYRETHLPLVAKTPGLARIEMSRVHKTVHGEPAVHLMAVMHFADSQAMRSGLASAEWAAAGSNLAEIGGLDLATMMIVDDPVVEETGT